MKKKVFIIAEIGINHNGSLDIAKELIYSAKIAGADAVKFQKRDINLVYSKKELDAFRESPWGNTNRQQKERLELSSDQYMKLIKYSKELEIEFFASAWDLNSLLFLEKFNLNFNKIASAMIIDKFFLKQVAKQKKYTFISTGMSTDKDIADAIKIFKKEKCPFELMHCISAYPFNSEYASLNLIKVMKNKYKCDVGYSGHEKSGLAVTYAAVALGATSIERHITLDRTMYGSDQAASLSSAGFTEMVGGIRIIEKAINGFKEKFVLDIEKPVALKLRSHINIKK